MRAIQVGILAALVVCAALLIKVYTGQEPAPAAAPAAQTQAAPQAAPPAAEPAPQPAATAAPATPAEPEPAPAPKKPSPTRRVRAEREVASARPHAAPHSDPTAQTPAPAPAPSTPAPAPAAPPAAEQPVAQTPAAPAPQPAPAPEPPRQPHTVTIPAGTNLSIRLGETINSDQRKAGDTFSGTLDQPLIVDGFAVAERGAKVQGKILEAQQAGRVRGVSEIALVLTHLHTSDGQEVTINTDKFSKLGEKSTGDDLKKVGVGAAIGAAIGAIAGGGKGAAIGAGVGGAAGAGTAAATRGKPVELPVETRLTFRLAEPVTLTEKIR